MDRTTTDHSDSDSGDSWTLIENSSTYADDAPEVPDHPNESTTAENHDKDEDTDGISIITDSEPESSSPCEINYENYLLEENLTEEHPPQHIPQFMTVNSDLQENPINHNENKKENDDFLGDSGEKHKTYVHRRNKRLSTVLNIIMLGSVITAAGVAIGHMWGAKTDCSVHTSPNVNKILSNLYKLQEENAYLWNKLKELTALNNHQMNIQKTTLKQTKCKKVFEEPLINNDSKKVTRCVDSKFINDGKILNRQTVKTVRENQILDVGNIKNAYQKNNKWLDDEIEQGSNQPIKKINQRHISKSLKHNPKQEDNINYLKEIIDVKENSQNKKKDPEEYLNETEDLTNEGKSFAQTLNYINYINNKDSKVFNPEFMYLNNNNKLLKRQLGSETDFSLNYEDQLVNMNNQNQFKNYRKLKGGYGYELDLSHKDRNTKTNFNNLNEEYNLLNDISHKSHQNIKKRESNRTFKLQTQDLNEIKISKDKLDTEEESLKSIKGKKQKKKDLKSNKAIKKNSNDFDATITSKKIMKDKNQKIVNKSESREYKTLKKINTPNSDFYTEEVVRSMKDSNLKKRNKKGDNQNLQNKNKGNIDKKSDIQKGTYDTAERDMNDLNQNDNQNEYQTCEINTKNVKASKDEFSTTEGSLTTIKDIKIKEGSEKATKSKDFDWSKTPKNENNNSRKTKHDFIKDKKEKVEDHYQSDDSDEELKKDNRYIGQKQKEERKKYDRQQSHKKVKRRNKYEQWEMKGGVFKDYDDISISSQENEYSVNEPNVKDENNRIRQVGDNSNNNNIDPEDNLTYDYPKSTQKDKDEDDNQVNWLDKRAKLRTEARQKLEQESPDKNGVNAAGWYFRRMRKREQNRGKTDNSTYRKLLKRKL